jgi:hypothetical protein
MDGDIYPFAAPRGVFSTWVLGELADHYCADG